MEKKDVRGIWLSRPGIAQSSPGCILSVSRLDQAEKSLPDPNKAYYNLLLYYNLTIDGHILGCVKMPRSIAT